MNSQDLFYLDKLLMIMTFDIEWEFSFYIQYKQGI